jgi:hypothetical protein
MGVKSNLFRLKITAALGVIVNSAVLVLGAIAPSTSQTWIDNNSSSNVSIRTTFRNAQDYTNCLENVLQLHEKYKNPAEFTGLSNRNKCILDVAQVYEATGIDECVALALIKEADIFATTRLRPPMFPARGIRARVAENFGYPYEVDEGDQQMSMLRQQGQQATISCQ